MVENSTAGNFQENIHKVDYETPYRAKRLEGTGFSDYFRECESLNGMWNYAVDQYDTCLRAKWFEEDYFDEAGRPYPMDFDFDGWAQIKVPSCWNTQAEKLLLYEGTMVYTRTFACQPRGDKRAFIKFGAANYQAAVFVNKQFMGMHLGGSTPFYVEVTDVLQEENRIVVAVNNTRRRTNVPCENTDWFNYGGIYRDVEMYWLPRAFIKRFSAWLEKDSGFGRIAFSVETDGAASGTAHVTIAELGVDAEIMITDGKGRLTIDVVPELWCPENPKLYEIEVVFGDDCLRERVGFREIRVDGTSVLLNGKKIFLKGICAHEESVPNGKAVTEGEIRENYKLAKEMNCNYMRLAHYPHTEKAARIADELGLLLWEELPVYWAIQFDDDAVFRDAENQLNELIARDCNRASVIIWSVGNENADSDSRLDFMRRLAQRARALDPTRLVSAACLIDHERHIINDRLCAYVDVIGINEYYGWYIPDFSQLAVVFENSKPQKPVVVCEFGADARAGARGAADELFTEDKQLDVIQKQIGVFKQTPYLAGTSPWILFDFRCPRRTHPMQNYYNLKGMLSADKSHKKLAFDAMRAFYAQE